MISRVTGGETSRIDGTLASRVEGAGVWLVNPSGIVFGPGARLDVPGSFHAGAAAEVRFPDGTAFGARDAAASRLSVAAPEGFGFLGDRTAGLVVAGAALRVPRGETLALAGDAGVLVAGGGPAGIVAAEAGRVEVETPGDVVMFDRAFLDASGDGAGTVRVRAGGTLVVEGFSALNADNLGPTDARPGAGIAVEAGEVTVASGSRVSADARGAGRGAGIDVATPGLLRVESRGVDAMTVIAAEGFEGFEGDPGDVRVRAGGLELLGGAIGSVASGGGDAGAVDVEVAGRLFVEGDDTPERAGPITAVTAQANPGSTGDAGRVRVRAGELELRNGGLIGATTFGLGGAGDVDVRARGRLLIANDDAPFATGIGASSDFSARGVASGAGGRVRVRADELEMRNGGTIGSVSFGPGRAGEVAVEARRGAS